MSFFKTNDEMSVKYDLLTSSFFRRSATIFNADTRVLAAIGLPLTEVSSENIQLSTILMTGERLISDTHNIHFRTLDDDLLCMESR